MTPFGRWWSRRCRRSASGSRIGPQHTGHRLVGEQVLEHRFSAHHPDDGDLGDHGRVELQVPERRGGDEHLRLWRHPGCRPVPCARRSARSARRPRPATPRPRSWRAASIQFGTCIATARRRVPRPALACRPRPAAAPSVRHRHRCRCTATSSCTRNSAPGAAASARQQIASVGVHQPSSSYRFASSTGIFPHKLTPPPGFGRCYSLQLNANRKFCSGSGIGTEVQTGDRDPSAVRPRRRIHVGARGGVAPMLSAPANANPVIAYGNQPRHPDRFDFPTWTNVSARARTVASRVPAMPPDIGHRPADRAGVPVGCAGGCRRQLGGDRR